MAKGDDCMVGPGTWEGIDWRSSYARAAMHHGGDRGGREVGDDVWVPDGSEIRKELVEGWFAAAVAC